MITSKREEIKYENNLPFKCYTTTINSTRRHYHPDITIMLVLKGNLTLIVNNIKYDLKNDDIFLINSNETHEIFCSDLNTKSLILHFDPKKTYIESNVYFTSLFETNDDEHLNIIKSLITNIYKNQIENKNFFSIKHLHEIISYLFLYFRKDNIEVKKYNKHEKRIESIVNYIENNYKNRITLQELANHEALSVSYLSNFIEKYFSKTFLQYYNDVRIDHAIDDLLDTNLSIEEIALNNGYDDPRSFVTAFKKRYNVIPSYYRKINKRKYNTSYSFISKEATKDVCETFELLKKYQDIKSDTKLNIDKVKASKIIEVKDIDYNKKGEPFTNNLAKMIGVVSAYDLLLGDVQQMLKKAKKEIGYEFIKFHGILSDEMELYFEDENGNERYNYFLIDKVLDFIVSIQMKPLIELTYMPKKLAAKPDHYVFNSKYLASEPANLKKWCNLVKNLLLHIINKYGEREVEKWKFTIWNLPETSNSLFGFDSIDSFFEFYKKTHDVIKDIVPNSTILSPTFGLSIDYDKTFITKFIDFCKANECMPDIFNVCYSNDIFNTNNDKYALSIRSLLQKDPEHFTKSIKEFKNFLNKNNINKKIELTVWMLTASHRNLINDTSFKSAYYVKNFLENHNELDTFAYWCLTDLNGESPLGLDMFYGGEGLFTRGGIEKSTYNAIALLSKLGHEVIYRDKGYFITKSHKKIQIIIYNYQHYSNMFADGDLILSAKERYIPFNMTKIEKYIFNFDNLNAEKVFIKVYSVGIQHGSSYDAFLRMGGIELKYDDEFEHLKRHSNYYIEIEEKKVVNKKLTYSTNLNPLEVKLIELKLQ